VLEEEGVSRRFPVTLETPDGSIKSSRACRAEAPCLGRLKVETGSQLPLRVKSSRLTLDSRARAPLLRHSRFYIFRRSLDFLILPLPAHLITRLFILGHADFISSYPVRIMFIITSLTAAKYRANSFIRDWNFFGAFNDSVARSLLSFFFAFSFLSPFSFFFSLVYSFIFSPPFLFVSLYVASDVGLAK
jgi:hypothetical protein